MILWLTGLVYFFRCPSLRREKLKEGVTCTADTHKAVEGPLAEEWPDVFCGGISGFFQSPWNVGSLGVWLSWFCRFVCRSYLCKRDWSTWEASSCREDGRGRDRSDRGWMHPLQPWCRGPRGVCRGNLVQEGNLEVSKKAMEEAVPWRTGGRFQPTIIWPNYAEKDKIWSTFDVFPRITWRIKSFAWRAWRIDTGKFAGHKGWLHELRMSA